MKILLVIIGLAVAVAAYEPIFTNYHEDIGIPEAARIKRAEEAQDFDGSRIVGGSYASLGAHPHMGGLVIALTSGRQSVCGSSLISHTRAATAAHCWRHAGSQARQFTVVLGSLRIFSGGLRINTNNVELHSGYNQGNLNNDVAVIRLPHVGFNNHIWRIALATGNNQFAGSWATAAGFGSTGDHVGVGPNQALKQVNLQVITNAVCRNSYGPGIVVASSLCVATTGRESTCGSDSGGPLAIGSGGGRLLIGIVSFGSQAGCTGGYPAGFARVTSFASWFNARL